MKVILIIRSPVMAEKMVQAGSPDPAQIGKELK